MKIVGSAFWNDRSNSYFTQENNAIEHLLRRRLGADKSWLETCGPTASINCQASVGRAFGLVCPGGYAPQPEDALAIYLNDPRNFAAMRKAWSGIDPELVPGNEVAQWYPLAVREVFGNSCEFVGNLPYAEAQAALARGKALQVCLRSPGHFVAIVAFDEEASEFIIKDSWGGRWPDGDGFCKRMSRSEYETNLKPVSLAYF
jgi:hypothetical protein